MDLVLQENEDLRKRLVACMRKNFELPAETFKTSYQFLVIRMESALANCGKKPGGLRYTEPLKAMCAHLFILAGLQTYEILCFNLPIPSVSAVRRVLYSTCIIQEGEFRFKELKEFLVKRELPLHVWISEDGTRIVARIQYDVRTNQIVGFVPGLDGNGLPIIGSFPATSANKIKSYFAEKSTGNYAYVIMAQPLVKNSPPFCLAMFCTDNRFTAVDVRQRWEWMRSAAKEHGIVIEGISSDGDPRLLKAMVDTAIPQAVAVSCQWKEWFVFDLNTPVIFLQDIIHILTKLKSRFTKPSVILPMGKLFCVSRGHVVELIKNFTRDQHNLCMSVLKSKDKMNFSSAERLCSETVTDLLEKNIPGSEGTCTYLEMMRSILAGFLNENLSPLERISLIWEWVFFLRLWKKWIEDNPDYTKSHNFITSNTYLCIELSAHALIIMLRRFRDAEEPQLFLVWLTGSQQCEKLFRAARSITGSFSTMVNFSFLELLHRLRRIERQLETPLVLNGTFNFPRFKGNSKSSPDHPCLPEDYEIEICIMEAKQKALRRAKTLGFNKISTVIPTPTFSVSTPTVENEISDDEVNDADDPDEDGESDSGGAESCDEDDQEDGEIDDQADVEEDICVVSSGFPEKPVLEDRDVSPISPFVKVADANGRIVIIRKSSLCWLLSTGDISLSSDRLVRVAASDTHHRENLSLSTVKRSSTASREENVEVGDWCAFKSEDGSMIIGRVLAFSYLTGSTWSKQEYSHMSAPIEAPKSNARGLGCLCTWYKVKRTMLKPVNMDTHGYYDISNYLFTIPRPKRRGKELVVTCSLKI